MAAIIVPVDLATGTNNPAAQISKDKWNKARRFTGGSDGQIPAYDSTDTTYFSKWIWSSGEINAKDKGAVPDYPTTDNAAALQEAINATPADGGDVVIPPGRYKFGTMLTLKDGVRLRGVGRGTWLYWTGGGSPAIKIPTGVENCRISDLLMVGTNVAGEIGILIDGGANVGNVIERIVSYSIRTHIQVGDGISGTFDHVIKHCIPIIGAGPQVGISLKENANSIDLDTNWIRGYASNGGAITDTSIGVLIDGGAGIHIHGGNIEGVANANVKITGSASQVSIRDVYMESWGTSGLDIDIGAAVNGVIIDGCYQNGYTTPSDYSIRIRNGAKAVRIKNNDIIGYNLACVLNENTAAAATARFTASGNQHTNALWSSYTGVAYDEDPTNSWVRIAESLGLGVTPAFPLHIERSIATAVAKIKQLSASGYGLALVPGADGNYALDIKNAAESVSRHTFYGDGMVTLAAGSGGKFGVFGVTEVVRQTDGAALVNNVTAGGTTDTIANYTDLTTYATDAAAIRNDLYQLARKIKIIDDALRAYGWLT